MTFYAASHLNERSASTGNTARRVHAFATTAERDQFVANYPTNDCEAVKARDLSVRERQRADFDAGL